MRRAKETWRFSLVGFYLKGVAIRGEKIRLGINNDIMEILADEDVVLLEFACTTYALSNGAWVLIGNTANSTEPPPATIDNDAANNP